MSFMVYIYYRDSRNNTNNEMSVIQFDPVEKDNAILMLGHENFSRKANRNTCLISF